MNYNYNIPNEYPSNLLGLFGQGQQGWGPDKVISKSTGKTIGRSIPKIGGSFSSHSEEQQRAILGMLFGNGRSSGSQTNSKNFAYAQKVRDERARMRAGSRDQLLAYHHFLRNQIPQETVYEPEWVKQARLNRLNNDIFSRKR